MSSPNYLGRELMCLMFTPLLQVLGGVCDREAQNHGAATQQGMIGLNRCEARILLVVLFNLLIKITSS
jgi:hypothetical protein